MGIRSDAGNANLSFVWNESPERYDISLKGALGVALATITGTNNQVELTLPDGRFY
jgi:outer membrane biogenesis lipoprotein LolB